MKRNVDIREISDGRLYKAGDMVRTDTGGCLNCGKCCHGMRDTIVLDPCDICSLHRQKGYSFQYLMQENHIELGLWDGLILPHLAMSGSDEACTFLDEKGRCSIHTCRPGYCRLYPLGRYYHDGTFSYIFQTDECIKKDLTKIKVKKWLGIANLPAYEEYVKKWHYFLLDVQEYLAEREKAGDRGIRNKVCLDILQTFFVNEYDLGRDFYEVFYERLERAQLTGF